MRSRKASEDSNTETEYAAQMAEVGIRRGMSIEEAVAFGKQCVQQQKDLAAAEAIRRRVTRATRQGQRQA